MAQRADLTDATTRKPLEAPTSSLRSWRLIVPLVITLGAVGWIVYLVIGGESERVEVTPVMNTVGSIRNAIGDREDLLEKLSIRSEGEPPNQTVLVKGSVKTKALLDELTNIVNTAAAGAPVTMDVTVKP